MAKVDHYIITYDVYNDARRKALHWRLRKWAVPSPGAAGKGQRSVMEAALTTKEKGQVIETASEILAPGDVFKMFKQQRPGPIIILGSAKKVKFAALTKHKPKKNRGSRRNHRRNASGEFTILAKSESDAKRRFRTAYPNRLVKSVKYDGFGKGGYQRYTVSSLWRDDVEAAPRKNRRKNTRRTNTGNLWWKHIKSTDRVEPSKSGMAWIVIRDGERYLVNWSSHDAAEAQAFLKRMSSTRRNSRRNRGW